VPESKIVHYVLIFHFYANLKLSFSYASHTKKKKRKKSQYISIEYTSLYSSHDAYIARGINNYFIDHYIEYYIYIEFPSEALPSVPSSSVI
jgi:hypothetical protein